MTYKANDRSTESVNEKFRWMEYKHKCPTIKRRDPDEPLTGENLHRAGSRLIKARQDRDELVAEVIRQRRKSTAQTAVAKPKGYGESVIHRDGKTFAAKEHLRMMLGIS